MYTVALHLIQINSLRMTTSPGNKDGEQDAASGDDDVKFEDLMDRPFVMSGMVKLEMLPAL